MKAIYYPDYLSLDEIFPYAIKIIDEESNEEKEEKIEVFPTKEEALDYIFKYNKQ